MNLENVNLFQAVKVHVLIAVHWLMINSHMYIVEVNSYVIPIVF